MNINLSEKQIQNACLEYLQILENQNKVYCYRTSSGAIKTAEGRYFKTGKAGAPDITCCYKGRYIALEIKTGKGRQSKAQCEAEGKIRMAKGEYYIIRDLDTLTNLIK